MTQTQKKDLMMISLFGFTLAVVFFIMGVFAAIDTAMDKEVQRQRLSVYCQQPRAIESLCASLKEGEQ